MNDIILRLQAIIDEVSQTDLPEKVYGAQLLSAASEALGALRIIQEQKPQ